MEFPYERTFHINEFKCKLTVYNFIFTATESKSIKIYFYTISPSLAILSTNTPRVLSTIYIFLLVTLSLSLTLIPQLYDMMLYPFPGLFYSFKGSKFYEFAEFSCILLKVTDTEIAGRNEGRC